MRFSPYFFPVASFLAMALGASAAMAADVDTLVFFGDSLTDEGRNGRTAPVMWPGLMRTDLSITKGANYAYGGSFTSDAAGGTAGTNFLGQVGSYLSDVNGSVSAKTQVLVWTGTNNIWQQAGKGVAATTIATSAAADVRTGLTTLAAAGATRTTLLGAYDLSLTNAYTAAGTDSITTRATAAAASELYNAQLAATTVGGTTISYYDIARFVNYAQTHPAQFGLTRVLPLRAGESCDASCQATSLFSDTIHLSSKGQALIAAYVESGSAIYNNTSFVYGAIALNIQTASATAAIPVLAARSLASDATESALARVSRRFESADPGLAGRAGAADPWTFYMAANGRSGVLAWSGAPSTVRTTSGGVTVGLEFRPSADVLLGASAAYQRFGSRVSAASGTTVDADVVQALLYGGVRADAFYVSGALGGSGFFAAERRNGSFGSASASPNVTSGFAALRTGYGWDVGPVRIGPVAGMEYFLASRSGYVETGSTYATLSVAGGTYQSLAGIVGLTLRGARATPLLFSPYLDLVYEQSLSTSGTRFAATYTYLPTQDLLISATPKSKAVRITAGADYKVDGSLDVNLRGTARVMDAKTYEFGMSGGVSYRF